MQFYYCIFVLLMLFINTQLPQSNCTAISVCTNNTNFVSIQQCVIYMKTKLKRNFIVKNDTCQCIQGYIQNQPYTDYCCPKNCSLCYWQGCYSCRANWTLTQSAYGQNFKFYYTCICKQNYIYDPILDDCICSGEQYAINIYMVNRLCLVCPQLCQCSNRGCVSCDQSVHRTNIMNTNNIYECKCQPQYEDNYGFCIQLTYKTECIKPNIRLPDQSCLCNQPYYAYEINNCKCKSHLDPTTYYQYLGRCYRCPDMCKCNKFGCVYCSPLANRIIYQNHCTCFNKTGVIEINGKCMCISPYTKDCQCNDVAYPQLFFTNSIHQCKKCPHGCQCDKSGCFYCDPISNRRNQSCQCQWPYAQIDDLCNVCTQKFISINGSCVCLTIYLQDLFYYDNIQNKCNYCPPGCTCVGYQNQDINGCNYCNISSHRVIQFSQNPSSNQKNYTCYCDTANHFQQNSLNLCQCMLGYVFNSTTNKCECLIPYYLNNNNTCVCSSQIHPQAYYSYSATDCRVCPLECNCSILGCYACSTKSGRTILILSLSKFICPCFPIQTIMNQFFCTVCKQKQYLWQNECIDCDANCKTCDENGCLDCQYPMTLSNKTCVCPGNLYYNRGSCICQAGFYLIQQTCIACPLNCANCQFNDQVQNMIQCIQCNIDSFRKIDITQQCPCIDYYVEAPVQKSYCCHRSCKDCNMSGCISCIAFTYRQLNYTDRNNVTCSCMSGFIQTSHIVCACPPQTYKYLNRCQACPSYCLVCNIAFQIINCSKCADGFNRKHKINQQISIRIRNSTYYDCVCIGGYQYHKNQTHCYSRSCKVISQNGLCAICEANRIQTQNVSYCNCTVGYYQDQYYNCKSCSYGCIKCISYEICEQCNITDNYYLLLNLSKQTFVKNCQKIPISIFYQEKENIIIKISGYIDSDRSIKLFFITNNLAKTNIQLNILNYKSNKQQNQSIIKLNNFTNDYLDPFLIYIYINDYPGGTYQHYILIKYPMYTYNTLIYPSLQEIFIYFFITAIMIISFIINILGEKHNQLMYYCQTVYFVAMNVSDSHMYLVPFLNYFRITIFKFTLVDSGSPFNDLRSNWREYLQKSYGNYRYFSVDNNLLRNVGLALYLAIQNLCLEIIFRIIYAILFRSKYKMLAQKYKKVVYRCLQWMRKVTMYPLLFFSLSTLLLYDRQYTLTDQAFRQLNRNLAIFILVVCTLITFLQFLLDQISKIYKYELLLEFFFNIANSVIIINSIDNEYLLFILIGSMLLKSLLQYIKCRMFMYNPKYLYNYIVILHFIQCLIMVPIYFCNLTVTSTLILLYIFGIVLLRIFLIKKKQEQVKFQFQNKKVNVADSIAEIHTEQKFV